MGSTNKTVNTLLSQFVDSDKPTWLGDYNSDMAKIEAAFNASTVATTAATNSANAASIVASNATTVADAATAASSAASTLANSATASAGAATTASTNAVDAVAAIAPAGSTSYLMVAKGATAGRPAVTVGTVNAVAMWYDSTLNKPIWSDGANWRDATGVIV